MYKYLFFDLDGTITDPGIGITNSIIYSLDKFGIHVNSREELYKFIGPPLMESYSKYYNLNEEQCKEAVAYYREYFAPKGLYENTPYPGIKEFLKKCKDNNKIVVLATSKPEHFAVKIMKHFELDEYFDYMCGSSLDASLETKADVIRSGIKRAGIEDLSSIVMIGDRLHDICGAKECNIDSIGVMWGYGSREEFDEYGANRIANDLMELESMLELE